MTAVLENTIEHGAAKKLGRILQRFDAAVEYVSAHHDELLDQHEDRFVGSLRRRATDGGKSGASSTFAGGFRSHP